MKNKLSGVCKPALIGMAISGLTQPALAVSDFTLSAGAGLEAHDNAGLTSTNEESDTRRFINTDIGYKKPDGDVTVDLGYSAEYGDYLHNVQSDQTEINGQSALKWQIAPRRFDAVLYHQISQQLTDRRGANVSSNREERSIITAGLDGYLHLSGVDSLALSPRFTDVHFQDSTNSDSKRSSVIGVWDHKTSQTSALDLAATYDHVTFDDSQNDYDSPGVLLSYSAALSHLSYSLGLGANRINRNAAEDVNGSLIKANIEYKGKEGRDWGASYIHQLTDTSIGLSASELTLNNFKSNDSNSNQFDIIEEDKVDAYWHDRVSPTSMFSLGAGYLKQDYKDTPRDQDVGYVQAGYQYTINSRWSTGVDGRYERTKFLDDPKEKYDTTRLYLNLTYHPLRPLEIVLSVGQDKRNADTPTLDYTDKVALLGFKYRFF